MPGGAYVGRAVLEHSSLLSIEALAKKTGRFLTEEDFRFAPSNDTYNAYHFGILRLNRTAGATQPWYR